MKIDLNYLLTKFAEVINDIDDTEDSTVMLEERIGSLEDENSPLLARLTIMEEALKLLENVTNIWFDELQTDLQGEATVT